MAEAKQGRTTDYKPEFDKQAEKLARLGATDMELADFFEVSVRTIHRWKVTHQEFCHSLKAGKEDADNRVERALYQRALGFECEAVKIFCSKDGEVTKVPYREIVAPDTTACIFWLKNRKREEWRDKVETEVTGADGGPVQAAITVTFVRIGNAQEAANEG